MVASYEAEARWALEQFKDCELTDDLVDDVFGAIAGIPIGYELDMSETTSDMMREGKIVMRPALVCGDSKR